MSYYLAELIRAYNLRFKEDSEVRPNPYKPFQTAATVAGVAAPVGLGANVASKEIHAGLMEAARLKGAIGKEKYLRAMDKVTERANARNIKAHNAAAMEVATEAKRMGIGAGLMESIFAPGVQRAHEKKIFNRHLDKAAEETAAELSRHRMPAAAVYNKRTANKLTPEAWLKVFEDKKTPVTRAGEMVAKIEQHHIDKMNKTPLAKITKFLGMIK